MKGCQVETAVTILKRAVTRTPDYLFAHLHLVVTYSEEGHEQEAHEEAAEILRIQPNFSVAKLGQLLPFKDPAVLNRYLAALRQAGLE